MRIRTAKDLGDAVKGRRVALGLSQGAVAAQAGVSRPWLSQVESGKHRAEFGHLIRLLDALGLQLLLATDAAADAQDASADLDVLLERFRQT